MSTIYAYCRISTPQQNLERQERNIRAAFPDAVIVSEAYTGTKIDRPKWTKLFRIVKPGDTIVFDEVSRMSRDADEGYAAYRELYERGVELVFLKERYIDTSVYREAAAGRVPLTGGDIDTVLRGVNEYLMLLAEKQIRLAFEQAEKEVVYLRQRTRGGMETARLNGKQIGAVPGRKLHTKQADRTKAAIKEHSKAFGGTLSDKDVIKLAGVSPNTYYKYKAELKAEEQA